MALLPHPPQVPTGHSDKVQHIIAFAVLAAFAAFAWPRRSLVRLLVLLAVFGAFIEVAQTVPVLNRDSDILDLVADLVGSGAVLLAFWLWRRKA